MIVKTSVNIDDKVLYQGKLLAVARKMTFSELVEELIKKTYTVKEMTLASNKASTV